MSVSSFLEIYLTQFGWHLYDVFWDIIVESGVAFLPFIGMFLRNIAEPIKSQEAKDASATSLRRIEIDAVTMFTVLVLAVQPFLTVQHTHLSFTKACANGGVVAGGHTGTTYDDTFTQASLGGTSAKIPIWWYAVLALSGAFNDAAILAIPCSTDIRLLSFKMTNARIQDPQLRNQVRLFYKDCYARAMTTFLDKNQNLPNDLPQDDIQWPGSQFFLNGAYQTKRASTTIPGFSYDTNRDLEYDPAVYIPTDGKPTCEQWWTGTGHTNNIGLRQALLDQIDNLSLTSFETAVASLTGKPKAEIEDIALRNLIGRENTYFNGLRNLNTYNDPSLANVANATAGTIGGLMEMIQFYPALYMMKTAAPIIQAVVLMLIYLLMPFYFLFSSYQIGKMIFMSIILFSVKFWTVLWAVAHWLDNNLKTAITPSWWQLISNHDNLQQNNMLVEMVLDFVIGGLFVVVPLFWSGVLTWAGHRVDSALTSIAKEFGGTAHSAGSKAGKASTGSVKKGIGK